MTGWRGAAQARYRISSGIRTGHQHHRRSRARSWPVHRFRMTGVGVVYGPNELILSGKKANTSVADNIKIGARLASYPIVGQADWISTQLISRLISNGAWRLLVFPGDLREPRNQSRLASFANQSNEQPHLPRFAQRRGVEPVLPPSPDDPGAFQPEDFGKPIGSPRDIPPVR